jgi:hypothetical protein
MWTSDTKIRQNPTSSFEDEIYGHAQIWLRHYEFIACTSCKEYINMPRKFNAMN